MKSDHRAVEILRLMSEEGLSQRDAGARLGLSEPATSKCLKRFRTRTAKAMALSAPVGEMIRKQLDEVGEVVKLAEDARALIELIKGGNRDE